MPKPDVASVAASDEVVAATRGERDVDLASPRAKWEYRHDLERHRAETERLRVLVDFLARPIHAHGGSEPDPDIITAYNLAVEAALQGIRRAACSA
ncbi:MAG: hypothetical protein JWN86_1790 [Planctomycetota bacterium]|nr:hypothetical protein [Planctomycetota bacterium]